MLKYHFSIRVLHWLMALIIIAMLAIGFLMNTPQLYGVHKSFGVVILVLFFVRIIARNITKVPALPEKIAKRERNIAKLGHYAFYVLFLAMPISGWLMSNWAGHPVKLFGLELFYLVEENKPYGKIANQMHEIFAYILIIIISLHVLGFLKHKIVDKVNLLPRIL